MTAVAPPPPIPTAPVVPVPVGAVVAWAWSGAWCYGTVEGRQDARLFVRPLTGTRRQRERRIPLAVAVVVLVAEELDLVRWLQARHAEVAR